MTRWERTEAGGYSAWKGGTDRLSICIIPELGSKAVSLQNLSTGREWLWRSGKPLGNEGYGSMFSTSDESGWDEMFPGIKICRYPEAPWAGEPVPNHGEVWPLRWESAVTEAGLTCGVDGVRFPYRLEKTYTFPKADTVRIDYVARNNSPFPFSFIWAARPLFRAREGMRLHVPDELNEIEVSYSEGGRLGEFGDKRPWPRIRTEGGIVDLSVVPAADGASAEKYYFAGRLSEGFAALSDPATGEAVRFRFPADRVPYLAVWANYGGFGGHYHIALEPATGTMDDLSYAMQRKEAAVLQPNGEYRWFLELTVT
ncbi:hypothetical protein [Paenibacillus humicola]|uniref:hypothetical protein n=1 Tax=Paenibacillus humicola TaxID=3110540 RepID=UPI00237AB2B5|nr:hypothetical protein [Paenibacillus humicola]